MGGDPRSISGILSDFDTIGNEFNGNIEGGASGNLKAAGVSGRELSNPLHEMLGYGLQEGVVDGGHYRVTPGSGLNLNVAAGVALIRDDTGQVAVGQLMPATYAGATVTIGTAHGANPRIDQIIATLTSYDGVAVSVLAGTATAGATLDNRTGAASLPNDAIRLADVLVPATFTGPFVQNTHLRDRRPWARGFYNRLVKNGAGTDYSTTSSAFTVVDAVNLAIRFELAQEHAVKIGFLGSVAHSVLSGMPTFGFRIDGDYPTFGSNLDASNYSFIGHTQVAGNYILGQLENTLSLAAGSHLMELAFARETAGTAFLGGQIGHRIILTVEEIATQNAANSGA